jgi:hypothetical protein
MKLIHLMIWLASVGTLLAAEEPALLVRFEVTNGSSEDKALQKRLSLHLNGKIVEGERVDGSRSEKIRIGSFESDRLTSHLDGLAFSKIDYQAHFDMLAKQPLLGGQVVVLGGEEVEVELHVKEVIVKFRMWNPDVFFANHCDDEVAAKVKAAIDAIVLELGKPLVFF